MTFKLLILNFLILLTLGSCSMGVEDKNEDLSKSEKQALRIENESTLKVSTIKFIGKDEIREDNTATSNIIGKYYTLEVCLEDKNIKNGLGNRKVKIEGKEYVTNQSGCVEWSHEIKIDPTKNDRCNVYTKEISVAGKKARAVNYSIDYYSNEISNLDRSRGCVTQDKTKGVNKNIQPIELTEVYLTYGNFLSDHASDKKYKTYATDVNSCLYVPMTDRRLKNTKFKLIAKNIETGEESVADPQGDQTVETNGDGCFKTSFIANYEQYLYSHWMPVDLDVEILTGSLKGTKFTRRVYVNPWESGRLHFGKGYRGEVPLTKEIDQKNAKFYMDGVMYIQIGNDNKKMEVNDYLGLSVSKTYQIVLNPYIDRGHRYTEGKFPKERIMTDGKFKLSLVLLAPKAGDMGIDKNNFENYEYITGTEEVVTVKNGVINQVANIPFKIKDLPRLAIKTMSIFKLEPLTDIGLRPSIVTGFFKAKIPWIKTNVLQDEGLNFSDKVKKTWSEHELKYGKNFDANDLDKACSQKNNKEFDECLGAMREIDENNITQETIKYRSFVDDMFSKLSAQTKMKNGNFQMKISPKKIYVNHLEQNIKNLKVYNSTDIASDLDINITESDFEELFPFNKTYHHMTENLTEELCRYAFHKNGAYKEILGGLFYVKKNYDGCLKNPYKYFGLKSLRHVNKLHGFDATKGYSDGFALFVGDNYATTDGNSKSYTESETFSMAADLGGKLSVPFTNEFLSLGFKAGVSKSYSNSKSEYKSLNLSESSGASKGLSVEKFITNINADFERCFLVTSKDFVDSKKVIEDQNPVYLPMAAGGSYIDTTNIDYDNPKYKTNLGINMYICDDKVKNESFNEAWYFVQSRIESSLGIDPDSERERVILKSFRGTLNFHELRKGLRDAKEMSLITDSVGYGTPEESLVNTWGHLTKGFMSSGISREKSAKFLLDHVDGSFPGTIEGNGAAPKPLR